MADGLQVEWVARTPAFTRWLGEHPTLAVTRLAGGEEAEIDALSPPGTRGRAPAFVLKRWRTGFRHGTDARLQYAFLALAAPAGLPVAAPAGWGWAPDHRQVLVTAFAGAPVAAPTEHQLRLFVDVLLRIHATSLATVGLIPGGGHPVDGILEAYFPGLATQPDIRAIGDVLRDHVDVVEPALIHGDFNLGNILLQDGTITVVDWTNVGASDRRYDLAWASVLLWIYQGAAEATEFRSQYLLAFPIDAQVLRYLEALAGLRWLLLRRQFPLTAGLASVHDIASFVDDRLPDALRGHLLELRAPR